MKQFTYTITDPVGIHARPAGLLAKAAKGMDSTITVLPLRKRIRGLDLSKESEA